MYPADTDVPNPNEEILCKQSTCAFELSGPDYLKAKLKINCIAFVISVTLNNNENIFSPTVIKCCFYRRKCWKNNLVYWAISPRAGL